MYTVVCTTIFFLTIIGCDYSKNINVIKILKLKLTKHTKRKVKLELCPYFKLA